jgi:hypothetical protein
MSIKENEVCNHKGKWRKIGIVNAYNSPGGNQQDAIVAIYCKNCGEIKSKKVY